MEGDGFPVLRRNVAGADLGSASRDLRTHIRWHGAGGGTIRGVHGGIGKGGPVDAGAPPGIGGHRKHRRVLDCAPRGDAKAQCRIVFQIRALCMNWRAANLGLGSPPGTPF